MIIVYLNCQAFWNAQARAGPTVGSRVDNTPPYHKVAPII